MVDLSKYKALFLSESGEHLQSMSDCMLKFEQGNYDDETIAQAFRNAHSIKGMAASMGYTEIRDLAHSMEDLLDQVRQKQRGVETEMVELLFKAIDQDRRHAQGDRAGQAGKRRLAGTAWHRSRNF